MVFPMHLVDACDPKPDGEFVAVLRKLHPVAGQRLPFGLAHHRCRQDAQPGRDCEFRVRARSGVGEFKIG